MTKIQIIQKEKLMKSGSPSSCPSFPVFSPKAIKAKSF